MSALAPSHVDPNNTEREQTDQGNLEDGIPEFDGTLASFFTANPKHAEPFVDFCFTVAQEGTRMDREVIGQYMAQESIAPDYRQHLEKFDREDAPSKVTFETVVGAAINSYRPEANEPTEEPSSKAAYSVATTGNDTKKRAPESRKTMKDWVKVSRKSNKSSLNGRGSRLGVFSTK